MHATVAPAHSVTQAMAVCPCRASTHAPNAPASTASAAVARSAIVTTGRSRTKAAYAGDDRTLRVLGRGGPADKIAEQFRILQFDQVRERVAFCR
jgi:hypothetical protein